MSASQWRLQSTGAGALTRRRTTIGGPWVAAGMLIAGIAVVAEIEAGAGNQALLIVGVLGAACAFGLVVSPSLDLKVAFLALYLGLLDGPVKLLSNAGATASAVRDVLIVAVSLGALGRVLAARQRFTLPPLSGWVIAFTGLVLVETLNPGTNGALKALGGIRQQLEFVPFFFFAYAIMRSKARFRQLFLLLGAIALLNGLVSAYQDHASAGSLAAWGPGYAAYVAGGKTLSGSGGTASGSTAGLTGRTFAVGGVGKVRPPGLGSDEGFGGAVGVLALPGILALMAAAGRRRRWLAPLLCAGAVLAIATSLQRTQVLAAVFAVLAFGVMAVAADRRLGRSVLTVALVLAIGAGVVVGLSSSSIGSSLSRYASISPQHAGSTANRVRTLAQIPKDIEQAPFGVGLATVGAAAGFGGAAHAEIEGKGANAESEYNLIALELGLPGLALFVALSIFLIGLGFAGTRRIVDPELRLYLVAVVATVIAFSVAGVAGPTTASAPFGPFFWGALGIAAYWFAGPGRRLPSASPSVLSGARLRPLPVAAGA
jgi:hypothetical protein